MKFYETFGVPSGTLGHIVFRRRRGQVFGYSRPLPGYSSQTPKAIANRQRFTFARKMSAAVCKVYLLKTIWDNSELPGYIAFEKFMAANAKKIREEVDLSEIKLIPSDILFDAVLENYCTEDNYLRLDIAPLNFNQFSYTDISAHGIMELSEPLEEQKYPFEFIPLSSGGVKFTQNTPLRFYIPIPGIEMEAQSPETRTGAAPRFPSILDFRVKKFAVTLILKDTEGVPAFFSNNITGSWIR